MQRRSWVHLLLVVAAVASVVSSRDACAQRHPDLLAAIDGTVVDGAGNGLGGVDVLVMDSKQIVRTKATGAYRVDSVAPGAHVLRFRRIGLQPITVTIDAAGNDVTGVDVIMPPYVHQLATVEVQGVDGDIYYIPKAFADRMRGDGIYLTEAAIAKRHAIKTGELLRGIPGIQVNADASAVSSTRGPVTILGTGCYNLPVYINDSYAGSGIPDAVATSGQDGRGGAPAGGNAALNRRGTTGLDAVDPTQIVGIEIYRGPSEMPATLPPSPCGAVVIWTK